MELTIGNDPANITIVRDALDLFGAEHRLSSKMLYELQVVLDEIVSNIIKYAWPQGGTHQFLVRLDLERTASGSHVVMEVIDDGQPYDPGMAPRPVPFTAGRRPRPGGVGLHMVKQLVHTFEYDRVSGHNRVKLTKRCNIDR